MPIMRVLDLFLYQQLNGYASNHDLVGDLFEFLAHEAQILFLLLLGALFLARGKWRSPNGRHGVVAAGFSALLALGAAQLIGDLWDRARPYEAHPASAHLLVAGSPDPSFPSDHATAAFAIAVSIALRSRRAGTIALAMAIAVSVARVAVGTHYPSDVIGGALLGTAAALVLWAPPIRRPLHALADWAGGVYERIVARILHRPSASA
jgi:undecaprenyl-diphosphatase